VPVQIPTLISSGPGGQAKLDDWPTCTSAFSHVKSVEHDYCVASDDHEIYWDENIDPYYTRDVTCRPMRGAFHASVPFTDMPHGIDRSRIFRPLDRGHGRMSRESSGSRDSRPKSRGSSRATSRASVANFEWIGDFMKKFADNANLREQREADEHRQTFDQVTRQGKNTVDFMQDMIRKQTDLAFQREKEIRADMKQLAASEARVAALEQQLQDQAQLKNPRGNVFPHRDQAYFPDFTTQSHVRPWCPSPVLGDSHTGTDTCTETRMV